MTVNTRQASTQVSSSSARFAQQTFRRVTPKIHSYLINLRALVQLGDGFGWGRGS